MVNLTQALDSLSRALDSLPVVKKAAAYEDAGFAGVLMNLFVITDDDDKGMVFQLQRALILGLIVFIFVMAAQICFPRQLPRLGANEYGQGDDDQSDDDDDEVVSAERLQELITAIEDDCANDQAVVDCLDAMGVKPWSLIRQDALHGTALLREYRDSDTDEAESFALIFNVALCQLLVPPALELGEHADAASVARALPICRCLLPDAPDCVELARRDSPYLSARVLVNDAARVVVVAFVGVAHSTALLRLVRAAPGIPAGGLLASGGVNELLLADVTAALRECAFPRATEAARERGYALVLAGHGVGAGAALIATLVLPRFLGEEGAAAVDTFAFGPLPVLERGVDLPVRTHVFVLARDFYARLSRAGLDRTLRVVRALDAQTRFSVAQRLAAVVQAALPDRVVQDVDDALRSAASAAQGGDGFVLSSRAVWVLGADAWRECPARCFADDFVFVGGGSAVQAHDVATYVDALEASTPDEASSCT